ncbi:N-6 DNA methylase [Alishewanella sp. HH-ZS]|uniref:N-6 DNA methylase n=1 Tax=Alishewanella sp. HH-ZS TaxID=1856684 RepID=UPI0008236744|nr:N-6 DNA methylase [Alishewanella sp. HH-ZS]OCW98238.1 hypothetical protein A9165_01880 [Alishewanella sp. HH-ZS]
MTDTRKLAALYKEAHNIMRNVDGLQPQEAFDELLKYLFFKQNHELEFSFEKSISPEMVRKMFAQYLGKANSWSSEIWREKKFYLSDECLTDIHNLLFQVNFSQIGYDVRSHALKQFLTPEIRRGLGIFLTPDEVVTSIVKFASPKSEDAILDPACGSGTFLIEHLKQSYSTNVCTVYGIDKSPRMLLLADLNIGHYPGVEFKKKLIDSLKENPFKKDFDFIFTNPPFGVSVDSRDYDFSEFLTCKDKYGYNLKKQSSEIVFIEKCFQYLKPGGTLAIVIPKSIATNGTLSHARHQLSSYGYIYGIMSLPPETFSSTGTQTTTVVLFAKKYINENEKNSEGKLALANIKNVGFDSTGRSKDGSQLDDFPNFMKIALDKGKDYEFVSIIDIPRKSDSFSMLENIFITKSRQIGRQLSELCEFIGTGKTPARSEYAEQGNFLIKVGNLSGTGINWEARDRNYINNEEIKKRLKSKKPLILQYGDILLTSSAHSPVYIAKKSDIFTGAPDFVESKNISFVGEIMLIRVDNKLISPFLLLAYLRSEEVVSQIQNMVRGQTAHLHASDLSQLIVPDEVFLENSKFKKVEKLLERQAELSREMNFLVSEQSRILN